MSIPTPALAPQEYLVTLPTELILLIAADLPAADLAALTRTCHHLHTVLAHTLDPHFVARAAEILLWAARGNNPAPLQRALSLGTPVPDNLGVCRHTLLYECARDGHEHAVRVLLANGVSPSTTSYDSTPLLIAVRRGHVRVARMLLEAGADVHQGFAYNPEKTPMMVARTYGRVVNEEMVSLLLGFGAGDEGINGPEDLGSNPRLRAKGTAAPGRRFPSPPGPLRRRSCRTMATAGPSDVPAGMSPRRQFARRRSAAMAAPTPGGARRRR